MGSYVSYYTYAVSKSRRFERYLIGYDQSTDPPEPIYQYDVVQEETVVDGDATEINVRYLEPNTAYYIKLRACNRAGCTERILGPIITWKAVEEVAVLSVQYRQNPLTGLLRIWWDSSVTPDSTFLSFTGTRAITTTVNNQTYIDDFELPPGTYVLNLTTYSGTGDDRIASGQGQIAGIVVKQHSVGLFWEPLVGIEKVTYSTAVSEIEVDDCFCVDDTVGDRLKAPYEFCVESVFKVTDATSCYTVSKELPPEKDYIYIEVGSVFSVVDDVEPYTKSYLDIIAGSEFSVVDTLPYVLHPYVVLRCESSFSISEQFYDASRRYSFIEVDNTFTIKDSAIGSPSRVFSAIDHAPMSDYAFAGASDVFERTLTITMHDGPYQPEVSETIGVEDLEIMDSALVVKPKRDGLQLVDDFEGSEVGRIYDFSHLTGGEQ